MLSNYLFAAALLLPLSGVGAPTTPSEKLITPPPHADTITMQCPQPNQLTLDTDSKIWSAPNGFKSSNTSFIKTITSFDGAQWSGAGLGQGFCVYSSKKKLSFPVVIFYNTMTLEPQASEEQSWVKKQGYYDCISHNPSMCTFLVRKKPAQETFADQFNSIKPGSVETDDSSTGD